MTKNPLDVPQSRLFLAIKGRYSQVMTTGPMRPNSARGKAQSRPFAERILGRRGPLRRALRYGGILVLLVAAIFFGGFLHFVDMVTTLTPPSTPKADAIVVLTGGYQRIDQAVELLQRGSGRRLLISGVHPATTSAQIRKVTQGSEGLFDCCVDIGYDALDTIGNASETSRWIHDRGYRTVLVVTSNYHMPRSLLELRRVDDKTEFIAYPVINSDLKTTAWYADPDALRTLLSEYGKVVVAYVRNICGWNVGEGLRSASMMLRSQS